MIDDVRVKQQIISLLNANERAIDGTRVYSLVSGDDGFIGSEIDTAVDYAKMNALRVLANEDSTLREGFIRFVEVAHGTALPAHYGAHGVPRITPYDGAEAKFIKEGVRKSVEEIASYRENPEVLATAKLYSDFDHDQSGDGGFPSPLAGFYSVVENVFYFTGVSAVVPLAQILDGDEDLIPAEVEPAICFLALGKLAKDGTISEKFAEWNALGIAELNLIRNGSSPAPSIKPTVGNRDRGTK